MDEGIIFFLVFFIICTVLLLIALIIKISQYDKKTEEHKKTEEEYKKAIDKIQSDAQRKIEDIEAKCALKIKEADGQKQKSPFL